ncbi:MAG: hypothetical protein AAGC95_17915, partial [Pseudomonadota bacterium]
MTLARLIFSLPVAAVVTLALFLLMRYLVIPQEFQLDEAIEGGNISIPKHAFITTASKGGASCCCCSCIDIVSSAAVVVLVVGP